MIKNKIKDIAVLVIGYIFIVCAGFAFFLYPYFSRIPNSEKKTMNFKANSKIVNGLYMEGNNLMKDGRILYKFIPVVGGENVYVGKAGIATMTTQSDTIKMYQSNQHIVLIYSYLIGTTEVTQELWECVMNPKESIYKDFFSKNQPAEKTYKEWITFADKLSLLLNRKFRLPTSFEWEFAAKGGRKSKHYMYAGGNDINEVAWYSGNANMKYMVASKKPNELGLYDMSGNVGEYTTTLYINLLPKLPHYAFQTDSVISNLNVVHGGSYYNNESECRFNSFGAVDFFVAGARLVLEP